MKKKPVPSWIKNDYKKIKNGYTVKYIGIYMGVQRINHDSYKKV